jgi:glycosyltransferase involved in cell wall biosynthesis
MISVLLPTYNSATTLGLAIRSIVQQTLPDFELLVLDDGSTDDTEKAMESCHDRRIGYHKLPHKGLAASLNVGLSIARNDIVARIDAGDIALPERLKRQFEFIRAKPKNTIVACNQAVYIDQRIMYRTFGSPDPDAVRKRLALHCDFPHSGVMYYREYIVENGGYSDTAIEDYELWLRIKNSARIHILPEVLMFTLYDRNSLSNKDVTERNAIHYRIQEKYYLNVEEEFALSGTNEGIATRGWREYFFGDRKMARDHWRQLGLLAVVQPRIIIAWLVTYLPQSTFTAFKESRMKFRIQYLLRYFFRDSRTLRRTFTELMAGGSP